ncbi:MAG: hypothetical protein J1F02_03290 [Lachnospiraceae bacterium]|nr:hypothetical protein [Lachnospiraceae bacterium]
MTALEVILIIVGFACICISFLASKKSGGGQFLLGQGEEQNVTASASLWTEKDEEKIRERVNELLEERQSVLVEATEDEMNRLCNEKIMAVDEFSKQILEKIDSNHREVVFMYNVLNEKEKEIKQIMAESAKAEPVSAPETTEVQKPAETPKAARVQKPAETPRAAKVQKPAEAQEAVKVQKPAETQEAVKVQKSAEAPKAAKVPKPAEPARPKTRPAAAPVRATAEKAKEPVRSKTKAERAEGTADRKPENVSVPGNVNLQIQKMYKEGKSILEISKALNIGQGEVKLVIALYGGRGR